MRRECTFFTIRKDKKKKLDEAIKSGKDKSEELYRLKMKELHQKAFENQKRQLKVLNSRETTLSKFVDQFETKNLKLDQKHERYGELC